MDAPELKVIVYFHFMSNPLKLKEGKKYLVKKPFTDFDNRLHPAGEKWIFIKTNFSPYDDGLTLHVRETESSAETIYRLKWTDDEQAAVIENFQDHEDIL